jgi:hypothetical protein
MNEVGTARPHGRKVESGQQRQLLQEHRALPPWPGLAHLELAEPEPHRLFERSPPSREVVSREQPAGTSAPTTDGLSDETLVVRGTSALDLDRPIRPARLALGKEAAESRGQLRVREATACPWHTAA